MPGLYLHVPFCRKACHYCDFHFSTQQSYRLRMVQAMVQEMGLRKAELKNPVLTSIYLGGGTPSLLSEQELVVLWHGILAHFHIAENAEITLELNPEDATLEKLNFYKNLGINRLSIGVQSFRQEDLTFMNRAHNTAQAQHALDLIVKVGFPAFTLDLMYGLPNLSREAWKENLRKAFAYQPPHFSAYCLHLEEKTVWHNWIAQGKMSPPLVENALAHWDILQDMATAQGYENYEISNFAKHGQYARHNTAYWQAEPYLGIGAAAHSFDGQVRRMNPSNNHTYMLAIESGKTVYQEEALVLHERYNEYVLIALRTMWGFSLAHIATHFGLTFKNHAQQKMQTFLDNQNMLALPTGHFALTASGKKIADYISTELFYLP